MRDKFMFFDNFKETADRLPDDLRLKFYDAMTDYVFKGIEPDDALIGALITAIKPSLDKEDKRGGNHNPTGQNQYSEVKKEVKDVKSGQRGQSFLETETETRNRNKKRKLETENTELLSDTDHKKLTELLKIAPCVKKNEFLISSEFSLSQLGEDYEIYKKELGEDVVNSVQDWLKKTKPDKVVDRQFICRQFVTFAKRQGKRIV